MTRPGKLADHAVRDRTQGVVAGADVREAEPSRVVGARPKLKELAIPLPVHLGGKSTTHVVATSRRDIVRRRQSNPHVRQLQVRFERIAAENLAGDDAALGLGGIIGVVHPIVGPARSLGFRARQRVGPEHGLHRVTTGLVCRTSCRRGGGLPLIGNAGGARRVAIDDEWSHHFGPGFIPRDDQGAATVMAAEPHVQQGRSAAGIDVQMAGEFDFGRPARQVFRTRIDEPKTHIVRGARPPIRGEVVEDRGVVAFVFHLAPVNARCQSPGFLEIQRLGLVPILRGRHEATALAINRQKVEHRRVELQGEPGFADVQRRVARPMHPDQRGVNPALAPAQRIADVHVEGAAAIPGGL